MSWLGRQAPASRVAGSTSRSIGPYAWRFANEQAAFGLGRHQVARSAEAGEVLDAGSPCCAGSDVSTDLRRTEVVEHSRRYAVGDRFRREHRGGSTPGLGRSRWWGTALGPVGEPLPGRVRTPDRTRIHRHLDRGRAVPAAQPVDGNASGIVAQRGVKDGIEKPEVRKWSLLSIPQPPEQTRDVRGKTCAESSAAQDEAPAIAHGVETPPLAAVRVNILECPQVAQKTLMESWLRGRTKGSTAGVMRGPYVVWEGTDIGRKAQLLLGRKSRSDHGDAARQGSRCAQWPGVTPRPVDK